MTIDLNDQATKDAIKQAALDVVNSVNADEKAKADAANVEKAKVDDAVKAAKAEWEKEAAENNRLPNFEGKAPYAAKFADIGKYDNYSASDLAFTVEMLNASRLKGGRGASNTALKALAVKISSGKDDSDRMGQTALKAIGIDPADVLSGVKANELDYSTQAGFGDEFVPQVWSSHVWELPRAQTAVLGKIPAQEFKGPGDNFVIPLEGADPTFYRIGQATDLNATTGRPDATVGDSKLATANQTITLSKVGARVPYSGEIDEDSILPWASQLQAQLGRAYGEQMEHLVIDGDTATGATTNINHIGGTPTSTGTKQDLFLGLNGFRKLALVTNTANSVSAAGSLSDTTFLQVAQLMGAAGFYADPTKMEFLIDGNVYWKIQQLLSVKTRDVFSQATLENGMFTGIWGYKVYPTWFMHWRSTTNPRKANTAGKVDLTSQANNTTGSILAVRYDQWLLGWKRSMQMKMQEIPDSDTYQFIVTARLGMINRDNEASAIAYNVGV